MLGAETVAVPIQAAGSNNCGPATILFGEKVAGLYKDWISSEENSGVIEDLVEELRLLPLSPGAYDDARQEWEEIAHVLVKARGRAERRASLRRIIWSRGDAETSPGPGPARMATSHRRARPAQQPALTLPAHVRYGSARSGKECRASATRKAATSIDRSMSHPDEEEFYNLSLIHI